MLYRFALTSTHYVITQTVISKKCGRNKARSVYIISQNTKSCLVQCYIKICIRMEHLSCFVTMKFFIYWYFKIICWYCDIIFWYFNNIWWYINIIWWYFNTIWWFFNITCRYFITACWYSFVTCWYFIIIC